VKGSERISLRERVGVGVGDEVVGR
jgi:hypothetical protein